MDRQQDVIRRITAHIVAYRFQLENERIAERKELQLMALELKGLKAKAMTARANIGKLDAAYDAFNAKAGNHVSDVESLAEQLGGMAEDLSFATTTLGNSVADSNAGVDATSHAGDLASKVIIDSLNASRGSAVAPDGNRVALGPHPDQPEGQPAHGSEAWQEQLSEAFRVAKTASNAAE